MSVTPVSVSESEFRAVLTSPFLIKKVTINAHTPYDDIKKEALEAYSREDLPAAEYVSTNKLRIKDQMVGVLDFSEHSADIVKDMINKGYSAENAIDFQKAVRAYGLNAINTHGGISSISNNLIEE